MKKFLRIFAYAGTYWGYIMLNILFTILTIVFSLFSFSLLVPFLNLLFNSENLVTVQPEFALNSEAILNTLNYYISMIIIEKGKIEALVSICGILAVAFLLRNLSRFLSSFFMANVRVESVRDIRNDVYKKILILPLSFYNKQRKGDIMARITTDVQEVEYSIMNSLEMIFRDPVTIIAYFLFMISMSPQLTLFVLAVLPITGFLIGRVGRSLRKSSKVGQTRLANMLSTIEESISGLRIIKAFNAIDYSNKRFRKQNQSYSKLLISIYRRRDLSSPMSEFLSAIVIIIVLWFGARLVLSDSSTINAADFVTYIVVFSQIIPSAKTLSQGIFNIQKGSASAERIFEILDAEEVIVEKENAIEIEVFESELEYKNVSFRYNKEDVLKNINLKIEKGKLIALVGESGGGKSTMADLLPRFYDVTQGAILMDGIDIRDYNIDNLRAQMGIVTQESILFNDTVFNNIAFGKTDATSEAVVEAAKIANAHEFIIQLENGYDSIIGDRGMTLSGGQRQRLSIARAILKNPPILILDEATSALDTESERLVQDALAKVMSNRTSIVIAHRLSTIQNADEIIVMSKGEIVERGKHDELIKLGGIYKKLTELQSFAQ
ncbi:MAG: ABC transporter ATP-binding protein/permease [Lentimicrobiaceae bacterium]|jgi:subfamily B ATP-binding cassette protein MsbA|nr:ABC transporter ATP-binding protein/permease [Lentimicrobiaceae bacterium]